MEGGWRCIGVQLTYSVVKEIVICIRLACGRQHFKFQQPMHILKATFVPHRSL
jgi:hypothetical protein